VADFIDDLIQEAKRVDSDCLCTFTNYPPTEFLRPQSVDFVCFNVYLHQPQPFRIIWPASRCWPNPGRSCWGKWASTRFAKAKTGMRMLQWQIESAFRDGLAGAVVFSYTDDWWHAGKPVEDWKMGLTTTEREPRNHSTWSEDVSRCPVLSLPRYPKVSVVVASYNGDRTLKACSNRSSASIIPTMK